MKKFAIGAREKCQFAYCIMNVAVVSNRCWVNEGEQ